MLVCTPVYFLEFNCFRTFLSFFFCLFFGGGGVCALCTTFLMAQGLLQSACHSFFDSNLFKVLIFPIVNCSLRDD